MKLTIATPPQWQDNPKVMATWEEAGYRRFAVAERTDIISAQVIGGQLYLATERSAAHKVLLGVLSGE